MNELVLVVEREKRGLSALLGFSTFTFFFVLYAVYLVWPISLPLPIAAWLASCALIVRKRRRYDRLLRDRAGIEGIERLQWLGRPALRVRFLAGGSIRLPTWNVDRERVVSLLEMRELPAARVLR